MRYILLAIDLFIFMTLVGTSLGHAQKHEVIEGGRFLYKRYCATCHGQRGHGDGVKTSLLKESPSNLTLLQKKNAGTFPFWETYRVIDGRTEVFKHTPRDMPVWGIWFKIPNDEVSTETEWADQVRGRIWQLLMFLMSIQES